MADANGRLTLEGLGRILRDHMDGTAAQFAAVGARIDDLRGEIAGVAALVRELARIVVRHGDQIEEQGRQLEEHRREIRQTFARMEHHDAQFQQQNAEIVELRRDIRRILDAMERRGDGGRQP